MDKKSQLLSNLKKQVMELKFHLNKVDICKKQEKNDHRSTSDSSRFHSNIFDSSYLDKGVKKFPLQENFRNLTQVIKEKSFVDKKPQLSTYRKREYERTKENFSNSKTNFFTKRYLSPNPVTG